MTPADQRVPDQTRDTDSEPLWITLTLRPFPTPITSGMSVAILLVLALFCCMIALPLKSLVAWGFCALFGVLAAVISAAATLRSVRTSGSATWGVEHYPQTTLGSTSMIVAYFCAIYGWFLAILMHSKVLAANGPGSLKYIVTVTIAAVASLFLTIYGRRKLWTELRQGKFGNLRLTPWQAIVTLGLCVGAGVYVTWLMT